MGVYGFAKYQELLELMPGPGITNPAKGGNKDTLLSHVTFLPSTVPPPKEDEHRIKWYVWVLLLAAVLTVAAMVYIVQWRIHRAVS